MPILPILAFLRFVRDVVAAVWSELRNPQNPEFRSLLTLLLLILGGGAVFYHRIEGWTWLDSFYFCVVTLATVGYGDLSPHTGLGKLFTVLYIFVGIGILAAFVAALGRRIVARHSA